MPENTSIYYHSLTHNFFSYPRCEMLLLYNLRFLLRSVCLWHHCFGGLVAHLLDMDNIHISRHNIVQTFNSYIFKKYLIRICHYQKSFMIHIQIIPPSEGTHTHLYYMIHILKYIIRIIILLTLLVPKSLQMILKFSTLDFTLK